ncbi:hypothetical protein KAR91_45660 [Candidatus Pacearchaeota archaeon]|nr:hypothetical protein [Candidatus Pacearchaeota archaeon]
MLKLIAWFKDPWPSLKAVWLGFLNMPPEAAAVAVVLLAVVLFGFYVIISEEIRRRRKKHEKNIKNRGYG